MNASDRNAARRLEYQIQQRETQKARQFAAKLAGFLNGELSLERDGARVDWHEEAACGRWLADFLAAWHRAGYRWSRWPHRQKIAENYIVAVTEGSDWPKLAIQPKPAAPIEGDVPVSGGRRLT